MVFAFFVSMRPAAWTLLLVFVVGADRLRGQQSADYLAKLKQMRVSVAAGQSCATSGLDISRMRSESELGLRRIGLRVVDKSDVAFRLVVSCVPATRDSGSDTLLTVLSVRATTVEWAKLPRIDANKDHMVSAWEAHWIGFAPPDEVSKQASEVLTDLLARFANDWSAANPRLARSKQADRPR